MQPPSALSCCPFSLTLVWPQPKGMNLRNPENVFGCIFRIVVLLNDEILSTQFLCIWLNLRKQFSYIPLLLLPSALKSSVITSVPVPLAATHVQAIREPPPCLIDEMNTFPLCIILHQSQEFVPDLKRYVFVNCSRPVSF